MKKFSLPRLDSKFIAITLSVLVLLYFIVFPMLVLVYDSFVTNSSLDFSNYLKLRTLKTSIFTTI